MNAFQMLRPRGIEAPSAVPVKVVPGSPPRPLGGSLTRDASGRMCVPIEPRKTIGFHIESGKSAQAATDKRRALSLSTI